MKTCVLNIAPGKTVRYCGEPCIVLEHRQDGTLLVVTEQIKYKFGPSNNFAASPLRAHLNANFLDSLTLGHPDEIITRTVDLTALNGSTEYDEALVYDRKPKTLSQLEELMGKKEFAEKIGSFVVKPLGKPTLAEASDKREAYNPAAADFAGAVPE